MNRSLLGSAVVKWLWKQYISFYIQKCTCTCIILFLVLQDNKRYICLEQCYVYEKSVRNKCALNFCLDIQNNPTINDIWWPILWTVVSFTLSWIIRKCLYLSQRSYYLLKSEKSFYLSLFSILAVKQKYIPFWTFQF